MGIFHYKLKISNPIAGKSMDVEALVDTGATYTWLPEDILRSLEVAPTLRRRLKLANGQIIERDAAEIVVTINGESLSTVCIFGDLGSDSLLGSITLETFSFGVDPVNKRLVPIISYLV